jgi:hypothetical protein
MQPSAYHMRTRPKRVVTRRDFAVGNGGLQIEELVTFDAGGEKRVTSAIAKRFLAKNWPVLQN